MSFPRGWAGLQAWGGDAKPWEIGQPWASGVTGTVPSPSAGSSSPSPSPAFVSPPPQPLFPLSPSLPLSLPPSFPLSPALSVSLCCGPPPPSSPCRSSHYSQAVILVPLSPCLFHSFSLHPGDQGVLVGGRGASPPVSGRHLTAQAVLSPGRSEFPFLWDTVESFCSEPTGQGVGERPCPEKPRAARGPRQMTRGALRCGPPPWHTGGAWLLPWAACARMLKRRAVACEKERGGSAKRWPRKRRDDGIRVAKPPASQPPAPCEIGGQTGV